jgi:hypothetical protein
MDTALALALNTIFNAALVAMTWYFVPRLLQKLPTTKNGAGKCPEDCPFQVCAKHFANEAKGKEGTK